MLSPFPCFPPKFFISLSSSCWHDFVHFSLTCWYNFFRGFGMSCFVCIFYPVWVFFVVFILSPVPSGLFPRFLLFVLLELLFSFQYVPAFLSVLLFLLVVVDFLSALPVEFPIQVLSFCSCFLREHRFHLRLIWLLHRLVRLIPWCFSLIYVLIIRLFFSFSVLTVSQSWFLRDGNVIFFSDIILFIISAFLFSSGVSVCSVVLGYVVCGVSITFTLRFNSVRGFLFFSI